jgi:PRC-barrel domain
LRGKISDGMERGLRAQALFGRPIVFRDIRLGTVADVILDAPVTRVLGLEVRCGDGAHRFLPLAACVLEATGIRVESALVLTREALDFYRSQGRPLTTLTHRPPLALAADGSVIPGDSLRAAV